ncbi:MAG: hypothetical protein M1820_005396 [Bogoriella megaspora]|nr:MAG: hypothetical protein M1820_005396 [Bogoriella megaspora]
MVANSEEPFRVAIVGGGIGGLFCALAIHHHCKFANINIDVYEQASQYKEIGAGVGLGINAAKLVHRVGLGDELNSLAGNRYGIWITFRKYYDGNEIFTIPLVDQGDVRTASCARTDLLDVLRVGVESRQAATLHTKKACSGVEEVENGVRIHFADRTSTFANVVIGCDGIHSAVRNQFIADKPRYSGQYAYRAVIPVSTLPSPWPFPSYSVAWCAKHKHMLVFPISRNEQLNIVAFVTASEESVADVKESWTSVCDKKDVENDFAGFEENVQAIIRQMPDKPSKWRLNHREPLDRWHYLNGRAILLGDAAHAMLPHLGAGAGQSLEDGWVLGRALAEYLRQAPGMETLENCAQHYQDVRLPRAQKVQRTSRVAGDTYEMQTEDMISKSYEECVPMMAERTRERMKWVWEDDLDKAYETMRNSVNGDK